MKLEPCEAFHVTDEPGDGTRYEFLVATRDPGFLWIASVASGSACPHFSGYAFDYRDLEHFAKEFPGVLVADPILYRDQVRELEGGGLLAYACEKGGSNGSPANPWTALAAIRAGIAVARTLGAIKE